jgi:hypothetical protein
MAKSKKAGLRARVASVKAAMSVSQVDEAPTAAGKTVSTTVRLDPERHDRLRTVAFHARRSMHSLLVEGVDLMLAKHKG